MSQRENELISHFKDVTGTSEDRARFYLDSANWTLQLALSSFYENQLEDNDGVEHAHSADEAAAPTNSNKTSANSSSIGKPTSWMEKSIKPKVATLHNMSQEISDDDEGEAFYAGGSERSGQQVLGPPRRKNFQEQLSNMFRIAQESGAIVDSHAQPSTSSSRGQSTWGIGLRLGQTNQELNVENSNPNPSVDESRGGPAMDPVILKLWRQGFSINDGDLKLYDDPENREFLENVMKGQIPNELRQIGNIVSVDVEDRRHEDFKKPETKIKIFKGSGHTLGSPAPETRSIITSTEKSSDNQVSVEKIETSNTQNLNVNENEPTTMLQIRLSDGSRLSGQFNMTHTINDIRQYIVRSRPQYANQNFILVTSFPTKELNEGTDSIDKAGLKNASILQRLI